LRIIFPAINNRDSHFYQADDDILYFKNMMFKNEVMFEELDVEITISEIIKAIKQLV
jgi:hypothetical protein